MDPGRAQRFGKHYYRSNYVPSGSRQVSYEVLFLLKIKI